MIVTLICSLLGLSIAGSLFAGSYDNPAGSAMVKNSLSDLYVEYSETDQSFTLSDNNGNPIGHDEVIILFAPPATSEMNAYVFVTNNSGEVKSLLVRKEELYTVTGTVNSFCWNQSCYPSFIYEVTDPINLGPGSTTALSDFYGTYSPLSQTGITKVRYTFFDAFNSNDSVSVIVHYATADQTGVYTVTFNVSNEDQQSIHNAVATLAGVTNAAGIYLFNDITPGIKTYSVSAPGYRTTSGNLVVVNEDVELQVVLAENENAMILPDVAGNPGENVTIPVEINNDDTFVAFQLDVPLPSGFGYVTGSAALNEARRQDHVINTDLLPGTNVLRFVSFSLTSAPFIGNSGQVCSFILTTPSLPGAYFLAIQNPIISDPDGVNIVTDSQGGYVKLGAVYVVNFDVEDELGTPVNDAIATLDGITNPAGSYQFFTLSGSHPYSVEKKYYTTVTGDAIVAGADLNVPIVLILAPTYNVTFNVANASNLQPIAGASVTLKAADGETFQGVTLENGSYVFTGILAGNYTYTVSATGLGTVNGSLQVVDQNVVQNVQLSDTFILTLLDNPVGAAAVLQGAGNVVAGVVRTVRAVARPAYVFQNWTRDSEVISTSSQFGFTMPAEDVTLTANFIRKTHAVNLSVNRPFYGTATGAGVYFYGDTVTLTGTPSVSSCSFVSWTEGGLVRSTDSLWSFVLTYNRTFVANFTADTSFNVTFIIEDQNNQSVNNAVVTLYNITNPAGNYVFPQVPPGTFAYSVTAPGFMSANGQVLVEDQHVETGIMLLRDENTMFIPDVSGDPGENISVDVAVNNADVFVAFQLDVPLPEGFGYVNGSAVLNEVRKQDHVINTDVLPGTNVLRFVSFSLTSAPFLGNSGSVCSFVLTTPSLPGAYYLTIQNPIISDPDGGNIVTGSQGGYVKLGAVYVVSFDVEDQLGAPVNDAVVTLDGITNPAGSYQFFALNGSHPYSVEKKYYTTVTGDAVVAGADLIVPVVLEPAPTFSVTFNVTDAANMQPISGAEITLKATDGETFQGITLVDGSYTFTGILAGNYTYTILASGYGTVNGSLEVSDQNVIQNVQMVESYILTLVDNPVGTAAVLQGAGSYPPGYVKLVRAVAKPTHLFQNWTRNGEIISTSSQFNFTMPAEDVTLTANFIRKTHTVSLSVNRPFLGSATGDGIYFYGDTVILVANPSSASSSFVSWTEGGIVRSTDSVWSFVLTYNRTFVANFDADTSFNVTFDIRDPNNQPLADATVTLYGIENEPGNYLFNDVPPGTYTFTVSADDYEPASGLVTVIDQPVIVEVVLIGATPIFSVVPESKDFGMVNINTQSDPQIFTVTNLAGGLLEIINVELRLFDIDQFILTDLNVYPKMLANGESLTFTINFAPATIGNKMAILTITDGLTRIAHDLTLTGTGYDATIYLPFEEDFTGVSMNEIPVGWERSHINWGVSNSNNAGGFAPEMLFNWEPDNDGSVRLQTPPVYFEEDSDIMLYFKQMVEDLANLPESYSLRVESSVDNGQTWTRQWNIQPFENIPAEIISVNLSALSGHTCILALVFDGYSPNISHWYIDDILICYVPHDRVVMNEIISEPACFDATNSIGIFQVTILNGAEADFISGKNITIHPSFSGLIIEAGGTASIHASQNIVFKPNVKINAGAFLRARIADLPYCCQPTPLMAAKETEERADDEALPLTDHSEAFFYAYPNPTSGWLSLHFDDISEASGILEIYNLMGNRVLESQFCGHQQFDMDLSVIPNGIYLLRVIRENRSSVIRVIKQ